MHKSPPNQMHHDYRHHDYRQHVGVEGVENDAAIVHAIDGGDRSFGSPGNEGLIQDASVGAVRTNGTSACAGCGGGRGSNKSWQGEGQQVASLEGGLASSLVGELVGGLGLPDGLPLRGLAKPQKVEYC